MAVKMRLQRKGRKKKPFYHIVVADARAKRDGRFIERLGSYNPMTSPATIEIDEMKAFDWLGKGAQPTDTVRAILRFKGVLYLKHLMRGARKGAFSEEEALKKWQEWKDAKNTRVEERFEASKKAKEDYLARVFGEAPPSQPDPEESTEETTIVAEESAEIVEEVVEQLEETTDAQPVADNAADTTQEESDDSNVESTTEEEKAEV